MALLSMKRAILAGAIVVASSGVTAGTATISGAESSMLANTCAGCHGTDGASQGPATPSISGLSVDYFIEIMEKFKEGDAVSTIMGRIAKGYSSDEIEQMAEHFAALPFVPAEQDFDASMAKKGAKLHDKSCEKCHSEGGSLMDDDAGILAGQWKPYLEWTLHDVVSGERKVPKKMKKKLAKIHSRFGDPAITALVEYYASQQ